MVFVSYTPATKVAIRLSLNGHSLRLICDMFVYSVSCQSLSRWLTLHETTQSVVRDPHTYEQCGCPQMLSNEDCVYSLASLCIINSAHMMFSDASAVCKRELLCTFRRSSCCTPVIQHIILQNPERMSILTAISTFGPLAILWELCLTFVNFVNPMLLFQLYTRYSVPENTAQI
ncbi:hypothetical protein VP01_1199g3 [Puccinia sorghi]|uniref:Uncharacterized protein n=1 Tax=Puccinia sorghi TaxID=27349 RepID=A0A0L6VS43_9BASI|nr:hypothetical protein VP01_1199g3 [Puccinia sorghi]